MAFENIKVAASYISESLAIGLVFDAKSCQWSQSLENYFSTIFLRKDKFDLNEGRMLFFYKIVARWRHFITDKRPNVETCN